MTAKPPDSRPWAAICHLRKSPDRYNPRVKIRSRLLTKIIVFFGVALVRCCSRRAVCADAGSAGTNPYETDGRKPLFVLHLARPDRDDRFQRPAQEHGRPGQRASGRILPGRCNETPGDPAVRGSSKRGGSRAMGELLQRVRKYHVAITPDGPRGPRRKIEDGHRVPRLALGPGHHSVRLRLPPRLADSRQLDRHDDPLAVHRRFTPAAVRRSSFRRVSTAKNWSSTPSGWKRKWSGWRASWLDAAHGRPVAREN